MRSAYAPVACAAAARLRRAAALVLLAFLVAACGPWGRTTAEDADRATVTPGSPSPAAAAEPGPAEAPEPAEEPAGEPDTTGETASDADLHQAAADVEANELGAVPVIMYHRLLPDGGGEYDLTPEEFRAELAFLYERGYRPIRTVDLVRGEIDVPAGTTPVVLTFDDGSREQAALDEDGQIAGDTAIGILLEFAEAHPDFTPVASLYLNAGPFGGGTGHEAVVVELHERGFELGNHSYGHANLANIDDAEVQRELAHGASAITGIVPEADVVTLSLPFGVWPQDRSLAATGTWEGESYHHEGVLLVGAAPAPSPFHVDFEPLAIPRIRSSPSWSGGDPDYGSAFWLEWLDAQPGRRYISDGNPDTIAFPEELADQLDPRHADRAVSY